LFPANYLALHPLQPGVQDSPPFHAMFLAANYDFARETAAYLVVPTMKKDAERSLTII